MNPNGPFTPILAFVIAICYSHQLELAITIILNCAAFADAYAKNGYQTYSVSQSGSVNSTIGSNDTEPFADSDALDKFWCERTITLASGFHSL